MGRTALSFILVAVAVGLSNVAGAAAGGADPVGLARAITQLLAVGYLLVLVVDDGAPVIWAWLWVVAMVIFAAVTVYRRAQDPDILRLSALAIAASATISLLVVFGLGVYPNVGRAVVPIAGMMIGSIGSVVVAARRIVGELADRRPEVEARLALGQPWQQASKPFVRSLLRTLTSQLEHQGGGAGLPARRHDRAHPGGVDPVDAVLVQAAIMYLILGCVATNVVIIGLGLTRQLFTPDHRLVRLARTAA